MCKLFRWLFGRKKSDIPQNKNLTSEIKKLSYELAEKDYYRKDPSYYWNEAKKQIGSKYENN
jgi:hypothetical protein